MLFNFNNFWRCKIYFSTALARENVLDVVFLVKIDGIQVQTLLMVVLDNAMPQFSSLEHRFELSPKLSFDLAKFPILSIFAI